MRAIRLEGLFPGSADYLQRELSVIVEATAKASQLCELIADSNAMNPVSKCDSSPVTLADYGSQFLLSSAIREHFLTDKIIAEEDLNLLSQGDCESIQAYLGRIGEGSRVHIVNHLGDSTSKRFWVIDPIDGTKGYLRGDQYAICTGLVSDGQVILAVLGCPRLNTDLCTQPGVLFVALHGRGAYEVSLADYSLWRKLPAHPAPTRLEDIVMTVSMESAHTNHQYADKVRQLIGLQTKSLKLDSQCKYGVVARGDAHLYLRKPTKPGYKEKIWDHAPGSLLISEAGGQVTDFSGNPIQWPSDASLNFTGGLVASLLPKQLHTKILQHL